MRLKIFLNVALAILLFGSYASSFSATYTYEGKGDESWEKLKLKAGDLVIIPDGKYINLRISVQGKGRAKKPIIIKAESPGGVVLSGASWIRYWGKHVVVEGFDFNNVLYPIYKGKVRALIANRRPGSDSKSSKDHCVSCVLQHVRIDNENSRALNTAYKWVELYGYNNTLRHNYFGAKKSESRVLQVQLKHANAEGHPVAHHIHHNYFASRNEGKALGNGGEALLIGESSMQHVDARVIVEDNLFYDASISGEPEVISNKSSSNIYRYNTVRNTSASLTLRHGNKNTVQSNWFFQNMKPGSGGIRSIGDDNVIVNNYIDGVASPTAEVPRPDYRPALGIPAGYSEAHDTKHRNGYQLSERTLIDNNTVLRSVQPVMLSTWYNRDHLDITRPPRDTTFTDNLIYQMGQQPLDVDWVRKQAVSVDFTPESIYSNLNGPNIAEYVPTFKEVSGNITDGDVSPLVKAGVKTQSKASLKGCDAFGTGDTVYEQLEGAGADLSIMKAPLYWGLEKKSARLGPNWLNVQWAASPDTYKTCL